MDHETFAEHLIEATRRANEVTRSAVLDDLPDSTLYLLRPNCSYDGSPRRGDEEVFPEDSLPIGQVHLPPTDATGVLDFLWRRGKVPEWIDVRVVKADENHTFVFLRCCGRFTAGECLYHRCKGIPPFQVFGPMLPPTWKYQWVDSPKGEPLKPKRMLATMEQMMAINGKFRLGNRYLEFEQEMEDGRRKQES